MSKQILTQEIINQRFFSKILKLPSGCWLWLGAIQGKYYKKDNGGYGSFRYFGVVTPAHIASCRIHKIEIPEGMHVDHLCRITSCVNPDHLEIVTPLENFKRGEAYKGSFHKNKTHCPSGHKYTEENTAYVHKYDGSNKYRRCKKCLSIAGKKRNRKTVKIGLIK